MKKQPTLKSPDFVLAPGSASVAVAPLSLVQKLRAFRAYSLAVNRNTGELFSITEKIAPSVVGSRVCVEALGDSEIVSRVCALLLLQVGGRAFIGSSKNAGGSWGRVALPVGVQVETA